MARPDKRRLEQEALSRGWDQIRKQESSSLRTRIWQQEEVAIVQQEAIPSSEAPPITEPSAIEAQYEEVPVIAPSPHVKEVLLEDPWEKGKTEYKVDVLELLKWTIASDAEHEHSKGERAITYLMLDNYYEKVMVTGIPGLNLELQTGEEQAMYFWFYRKSYGYGYAAFPMGQLELAHKLKWSRDRVKRHLASLIKKGHITPLENIRCFRTTGPRYLKWPSRASSYSVRLTRSRTRRAEHLPASRLPSSWVSRDLNTKPSPNLLLASYYIRHKHTCHESSYHRYTYHEYTFCK